MTRSVLIILCAVLSLSGCQDRKTISQLDALRAQIDVQGRNKAVVTKLIEGLNGKDTLMYAAVYAPNCAFYLPSASTKPTTREEDVKSTRANWRAFPNIHFTIEEMLAENDMVATRFTVTGTQKEDWNGVPATGKTFLASGIFTVRIADGKVIEQREDFDLLGLFLQLGMQLKKK